MDNQPNIHLDNIALNIGTEIKEKNLNNVIINNANESDKLIKNIENSNMQNDTLLPGSSIGIELEDNNTLKENAMDNLIQAAANKKLKKEMENKLNDRIKEYVINSIIDANKREFYETNGYSLAGRELRRTIRSINTKWEKGKIKITPKQKQEIIDYLNLPSSNQTSNEVKNTNNDTPVAVSSVMSPTNNLKI